MIKIFYGDNRVKAKQEITNILGTNYEIIEGTDIEPNLMPSIFLGQSLFDSKRKILIRDLSANKAAYEKLPEFLNTPHDVIILESKPDKRSATYKTLKDQIEIKEFVLPPDRNLNLVYDIYKVAKHDGKKAIKMLEKIKNQEEPMMFFGLLVSQALKDYANKQGPKEKKALKELSRLDVKLKSSKLPSWLLIESFLLELSSL